jgi:hypothetical protein
MRDVRDSGPGSESEFGEMTGGTASEPRRGGLVNQTLPKTVTVTAQWAVWRAKASKASCDGVYRAMHLCETTAMAPLGRSYCDASAGPPLQA